MVSEMCLAKNILGLMRAEAMLTKKGHTNLI